MNEKVKAKIYFCEGYNPSQERSIDDLNARLSPKVDIGRTGQIAADKITH